MKKLRLTNHAKIRILDHGLTINRVLGAFNGAQRVKENTDKFINRVVRHGEEQVTVELYYGGGLLYVVRPFPDYFLLVTVTPKRRSEVKF